MSTAAFDSAPEYDIAALDSGGEHGLAGTIFSGKLHFSPITGSTNSDALAAARSGAPHGSVFFADEQSAGRGRGQRLIEGGDVGHDGQVQLLVNSLDEFLPMVAIGPGAIGTIESYDGGAGSGQGGGGGEIGRDARSRRAIPLLDADDGQLCILPDSRYMFRAVEAQAGGPSANRGHCDAVNGVGVVQRIAGGSLA